MRSRRKHTTAHAMKAVLNSRSEITKRNEKVFSEAVCTHDGQKKEGGTIVRDNRGDKSVIQESAKNDVSKEQDRSDDETTRCNTSTTQ